MSRRARLITAAVALGVLLLFALFPVRQYVAQRRSRRAVAAQVRALEARNRQLEERVRLLHTDAEIERLAREQYNLVRPGEEAYAILPPRAAPTPAAPSGHTIAAPHHQRADWLHRSWYALNALF